jgi:hypothetical protein
MAIRSYLCGSSRAVYYEARSVAPAAVRPEAETARLFTPIHFRGAQPAARGFRVVAGLADGGAALVCLGATAAEALAAARALAGSLPAGAVELRLERWVGGPRAGRWQTMRCRRGVRPRRRPGLRRQRRQLAP